MKKENFEKNIQRAGKNSGVSGEDTACALTPQKRDRRLDSDIPQQVRELIAGILGIDTISDKYRLRLGPLDMMELVFTLEMVFDIEVKETAPERWATAADVVQTVLDTINEAD